MSWTFQRNLFDAFTHLAPRVVELKRYVWADFVCINRSDDVEKASEVLMMKDIYSEAAVVRAWLGMPRDEERTRLAVELITEIASPWKGDRVVYVQEVDLHMRDQKVGFPDGTPRSVTAWEGVKELFDRAF